MPDLRPDLVCSKWIRHQTCLLVYYDFVWDLQISYTFFRFLENKKTLSEISRYFLLEQYFLIWKKFRNDPVGWEWWSFFVCVWYDALLRRRKINCDYHLFLSNLWNCFCQCNIGLYNPNQLTAHCRKTKSLNNVKVDTLPAHCWERCVYLSMACDICPNLKRLTKDDARPL